jgi:hypothetical protein
MSNYSSAASEVRGPNTTSGMTTVQSWAVLLLFFLAIHFGALFSPSLLDDADATHANAARAMAQSGDWVTLKVNGLRYLEKPPLPYWLVAINYRLFGENVFSTHLPLALSVLGCAILAWAWARRAYSERAAFYAALGVLTSIGIFLFTRIFIPEVLLTLFLGLALYCFLTGMEDRQPSRIYMMWALLALALLTKGLIAPSGHSLSDSYGAVATLARTPHLYRRSSVSRDCGAMAHPRRAAQSGSWASCRQHSYAGKCSRLLLLLFHQRARFALSRKALSARLLQAAHISVLEPSPCLALSVEPVFPHSHTACVENAAPLAGNASGGTSTDCGLLSGGSPNI